MHFETIHAINDFRVYQQNHLYLTDLYSINSAQDWRINTTWGREGQGREGGMAYHPDTLLLSEKLQTQDIMPGSLQHPWDTLSSSIARVELGFKILSCKNKNEVRRMKANP